MALVYAPCSVSGESEDTSSSLVIRLWDERLESPSSSSDDDEEDALSSPNILFIALFVVVVLQVLASLDKQALLSIILCTVIVIAVLYVVEPYDRNC